MISEQKLETSGKGSWEIRETKTSIYKKPTDKGENLKKLGALI